MNKASLVIAGFSLFAAHAARAQDVAKVASDTHKVIAENDRARVLDVLLKQGAKSPMHSHPPNIIYVLTDGKLRFTLPDGKTVERVFKPAEVVMNDAQTHSAENIGTTDLHAIQIELKEPAGKK